MQFACHLMANAFAFTLHNDEFDALWFYLYDDDDDATKANSSAKYIYRRRYDANI